MNRKQRRTQDAIERHKGTPTKKPGRLNWEPWPIGDWGPWLKRMEEINPDVPDMFTRLRLPAARALSPDRVAELGEAIMAHLQAKMDAMLAGTQLPTEPEAAPPTHIPEE